MATGSSQTRGAVIYTRVSTGEQAENGTSLETQRAACVREAEYLGLSIVEVCEDPGVSGTRYETRPGIVRALSIIEGGRASVLIAAKLDRVGRSAKVILDIADRVEGAGAELVTGDVKLDKSPMGRMMRTMLAGWAEMERDTIRDRTMSGKRRRAEQGQQPQRTTSPYGYHIVSNAEVAAGLHPEGMRGRYLVDKDKAPVVRRIFADALAGLTQQRIARCLNTEGVPSPEGRRWWSGTVGCILSNPAYRGEPVSGRLRTHCDERRLGEFHRLTGRPITTTEVRTPASPEQWLTLSAPALVSPEDWEAVQKRREENRARLTGNPRSARMLSGKATCPACGGKAVIKYQQANGKRYSYLTCAAARREHALTGEKVCTGKLYPLALMEEAAARIIGEIAERPESLAAAERVYAAAPEGPDLAGLRRELAALDDALRGLQDEEEATVKAQVAGIMVGADTSAYISHLADTAARRKDMEGRRGSVRRLLDGEAASDRAATAPHATGAVRRALADAHALLTDPDIPGAVKRDLLLPIVERVICHEDGAAVVFVPGLFHGQGEGPVGVNELTKRPASA